jgi:hypothetical protein
MLDRIFLLSGHRGALTTTDEITFFEEPEIRFAADEPAHRPHPEHPTDYRSGLKRCLLQRRQQVDAGRKNGLDGIGDVQVRLKPSGLPRLADPLEIPAVNQRSNQLLDEEGITLRPRDDEVASSSGHGARRQPSRVRARGRGNARSTHDTARPLYA